MLRRLTTTLLGLALLASWSELSTLHIHAYADHDHAEHRHGPATHDHASVVLFPESADAARLAGCDPAVHVVSVDVVCEGPPASQSNAGEAIAPITLARDTVMWGQAAFTDVRAHGPPGLTQAAPRAPPSSIPA